MAIDVRPMLPGELDVVIRLWHATCADTYGFIAAERDRTLDDRTQYFTERIATACALWVAVDEDRIVGFLALKDGGYADRLYVHPDAQRRGVGGALVARAREISPAGLRLHTHVKNSKACAFYEKHGFSAVRFGLSPAPELEPDVEYQWSREPS